MIDSDIKNLGNVEYDNKNCLQIKNSQFRRKIRSEVYLLVPLYINRSITKNFPIKTLLKLIDSSIKNLGDVEYDE